MRLLAKAKINLSLNVVGAEDGYHLLDSVVTTISLADVLVAKKSSKNTVSYKNFSIPKERDNVYKTLERLTKEFGHCLSLKIKKNIPLRAGLGGSSALVAGVIVAYAKLYNVTDRKKLMQIASSLSSDAPCQIVGGYTRMMGRGEIVNPINCDKRLYFVIVADETGVDTARCFKLFDEVGVNSNVDNDALIRYLLGREQTLCVGNDLLIAAMQINKNVESIYGELSSLFPLVCMSGSGSAIYAVFEDKKEAKSAYKKIKKKYPQALFCKNN